MSEVFKVPKEVLPRDNLSSIKPHRGLMVFDPESDHYPKFPVTVGLPNQAGFLPIIKKIGTLRVGVIYLRKQGSVESGYYAITPRDIYRRRIDARPCRKLTAEQATLLVGGKLEHLASRVTNVSERASADEPAAGFSAQSEELVAADMAVEEQIATLYADKDPEGWI